MTGSGFLEMTLMKRPSFLSPDTFPAGFFYQERFEKYDQSRHIKLMEGLIDNSQLAVSVANGQSHVSLADPHIIRKPLPSRACTDTAVTVELSAHPDSNCALSLLSANRVNHHACTRLDHNSAENLGTGALKGFAINGHSSGTMNQEGILNVHDGSMAVSFKRQRDATFQVSEYRHADCRPSSEIGTLNLLQLSSHLQRVEQQKNSGK